MNDKLYKYDDDFVSEKIKDRICIFIDTNAWIDVAENKVPFAYNIKSILLDLSESAKVFCPLSAPLIWELYKQKNQSQLLIADLMDKISLGACYKSINEIFNVELKFFVEKLLGKDTRDNIGNIIYVPILFYLSSYYGMSYPEEWTEDNIALFENFFHDKYQNLTLTELLTMRQCLECNPIAKINTLRNPHLVKERWEVTRGDWDKLLRIEEESIARNYMLPFLSKLPHELKFAVLSIINSLPKDKYGGHMQAILESLPALKNHIEIMALSGINPLRKAKPSDFFDLEMLSAPLAYADAFVSQDKWMKDMVCNRGRFLERTKCKYISSLTDFKEYLEAL